MFSLSERRRCCCGSQPRGLKIIMISKEDGEPWRFASAYAGSWAHLEERAGNGDGIEKRRRGNGANKRIPRCENGVAARLVLLPTQNQARLWNCLRAAPLFEEDTPPAIQLELPDWLASFDDPRGVLACASPYVMRRRMQTRVVALPLTRAASDTPALMLRRSS